MWSRGGVRREAGAQRPDLSSSWEREWRSSRTCPAWSLVAERGPTQEDRAEGYLLRSWVERAITTLSAAREGEGNQPPIAVESQRALLQGSPTWPCRRSASTHRRTCRVGFGRQRSACSGRDGIGRPAAHAAAPRAWRPRAPGRWRAPSKYGKHSQCSKHSKRSQYCHCSGHTLRGEAALAARVSGGKRRGRRGRRGCE